MIDYPTLEPYLERYEHLQHEPLHITLELVPGSRIAGYDPVNLDNLLARTVVDEATHGLGLPSTPEAYRLPVPLCCLWRSSEGLPLWAATPFFPAADHVADVAYWHKRAQTGEFTRTKSGRFAIRSTQGRWMDRRVPLPTQVCDRWEAWCIGNADEIARLLPPLTHIGKKRSMGFGEVRRWNIEPAASFDLVRDGRLTRSMPAMAVSELLPGREFAEEPAPVGWTPPQWKPSLFLPGWWPGTLVEVPEVI